MSELASEPVSQSEPSARAQTEVNATPEAVYALISDLPGLSKVAAEFERGNWLDGVTQARVGARFRGHNKSGWRRWWTVATVTDADPGRRFAFNVTSMGWIPIARWQYDIQETDGGCRVEESTWYRVPDWYKPIGALATGSWKRSERNQRNIERTLRQLKQAAEAAS